MHQTITPPAASRVPSLIKRNVVLFALSQSFTGAGTQLGYGIGPLMVVALTGSASLAGLTVGLFGLSRFAVAYPIGKITDAFGRKPGIQLGLVLALVGTLTVGTAMMLEDIWSLSVGMLVFGMGINAANQMRVAAADMFPPRLRAEALGYVALGALVGLLISPIMMAVAEIALPGGGSDTLGLPWLMLPVLIVGGMGLVAFVQPDPKEIGMRLEAYYPDYTPPATRPAGPTANFDAWFLFRNRRTLLALVCNWAAQGNMAIVMVLTSLVLHHHGHSLTAISLSHMFHSAGMFGFTIPLGKLADRYGREPVMYPGVAVTLIGAIMVTFTPGFFMVTLGTFLVGIGWAAANVAATALVADSVETQQRGRAIGVSESGAGAMAVFAAIVTGPLIDLSGLPAAGIAAVAVAAVPLLMWAAYAVMSASAGRKR